MMGGTTAELDERFKQLVQLKDKYGYISDVKFLAKMNDDNLEKRRKDVSLRLEGDGFYGVAD